MSKYFIQIASVFALAGVILTVLLVNHHYNANFESAFMDAVCGQNSTGCDDVNRSSMSEMGGLPTAVWGLFLYLLILISLIAYSFSKADFLVEVSFFLAALGVFADLILFAVMVVSIGSLCMMCILTYLVNIIICVLLFLFVNENKIKYIPKLSSLVNKTISLPVFYAIAILTVVSIGGWVDLIAKGSVSEGAGSPQYHLSKAKEGFKQVYFGAKTENLNNTGRPRNGDANSPVTITVFADFMCPHCKIESVELGQLVQKYPNHVSVVFRHYPLDKACNPAMTNQLHEGACLLAYAAQCAQEQNRFWNMHDAIFQYQEQWNTQGVSRGKIDEIAARTLNVSQFNQCMQSSNTKKVISEDIIEANNLGIRGTPAVYVNGRTLNRDLMHMFFEQIIEAESQKQPGIR